MKIYLSSDMEGTAGVVDWSQCRIGQPDYEHYRHLLQDEVNAAIEGAMAAGADEVVVNDSHGQMRNLDPEHLAGGASYISGRHKPMYMMQGLDDSFDGCFFVSYHGSMGAEPSTLSHTYNPSAIAEVRLNGIVAGEAGINALVASAHGVPVALVTGDVTTARETAAFCPGIETVVVKESVSRFAAASVHPTRARDLIRAGAETAVGRLSELEPPPVLLPATLKVRFRNADLAEQATWLRGVRLVDTTVVEMTDEDPLRLYRTFVTAVQLTRNIAE